MKVIVIRDICVPYYDFHPMCGTENSGEVSRGSSGTGRVVLERVVDISPDTAIRWAKTKIALEAMQMELETLYEQQENTQK